MKNSWVTDWPEATGVSQLIPTFSMALLSLDRASHEGPEE